MYPPISHHDQAYSAIPTAPESEQLKIKEAFKKGAIIEAKGRDSVFYEAVWAVAEQPKFDFHRHYYRVKPDI